MKIQMKHILTRPFFNEDYSFDTEAQGKTDMVH